VDHVAAHAAEELVQRQLPRGALVAAVDEDQVDVRAEVELLRAVLAHRERGDRTGPCARPLVEQGRAVALTLLRQRGLQRRVDADVGDVGQLEPDLLQRGEAELAGRQPHVVVVAEGGDRRGHPLGLVGGVGSRRSRRAAIEATQQVVAQPRQQPRLAEIVRQEQLDALGASRQQGG
jgi:hypothetical protein